MLRVVALFLALISLPAAGPASAQVPQSREQVTLSFAPVVKAAAPAVVNIYAKRVVHTRVGPFADDPFFSELFRGQGQVVPRVQNSLGSGVIVSEDGIVVSNFHVVGRATEIRVVLNDRREFDAEVLLGDEQADLAVLRIRDASDLPALPFRDSDELEVGDLVLAIGNPFGIGQTVSSGIISGLARSGISIGGRSGVFIQTDAAINPGNSGGALVDMRGRLVGINTAILTRSGGSNGIGFAIPSNLVRRAVEQAQGGQTGFASAWSGLSAQEVDAALAEGLGIGRPTGVVITGLHPQSPFRGAGLTVGDVILELDGAPVNTPQELQFRLDSAGVGARVPVTYFRKGREAQATVALIAPPEDPPRDPVTIGRGRALEGLKAINLNPAAAQEFDLSPGARGVMVTDPGKNGRRVGLRAGDVFLRINRQPVRTTDDLVRLAEGSGQVWTVEYRRGNTRGVLRFRF